MNVPPQVTGHVRGAVIGGLNLGVPPQPWMVAAVARNRALWAEGVRDPKVLLDPRPESVEVAE